LSSLPIEEYYVRFEVSTAVTMMIIISQKMIIIIHFEVGEMGEELRSIRQVSPVQLSQTSSEGTCYRGSKQDLPGRLSGDLNKKQLHYGQGD
jgi:hypothetical protein